MGRNEAVLMLPDDFDDYAWEIEGKGWFDQAEAAFRGKRYCLTFYDPVRLSQDIEGELEQSAAFVPANLVVIARVTKGAMEEAVASLAQRDEFALLRPESD